MCPLSSGRLPWQPPPVNPPANPRDDDSHSPQLGEVVQGLPQPQHLSAGHESFLWAFQHLLQLHLGEHQAAGRRENGSQHAFEGAPCPRAFFPRWDPKGFRPTRAAPTEGRVPTSMAASAIPLNHLNSPCLSFSILCAKAQSTLLHSPVSTLLIHLCPDHSVSCPALSEALSSVVISLALFADPL